LTVIELSFFNIIQSYYTLFEVIKTVLVTGVTWLLAQKLALRLHSLGQDITVL